MTCCPFCGTDWSRHRARCVGGVPPVDLNDDRGLAGRVISGYEIIGRIGEGGMGTVYLALDNIKEGQLDAVKVLNRDLVLDRERMRREAVTANRVDHPNVCQIYNYVETYDAEAGENLTLIAMELVRGPTLKEVQDRTGGTLPLDRAARVVREVANALQAVHAAGIIHRDIKPTNIIVSHDPNGAEKVKLVDFGIAKKEHGGEGQDLTEAGYVAATVHYASPEQLKGKAESRSDIYSLGVVLFELLTGRRPFEAESQAELYSLILDPGVSAPRLNEVRGDLDFPGPLQAVLDGALARDLAKRYSHAAEFAEAVGGLVPDLAKTVVSPVAELGGVELSASEPSGPREAGAEVADLERPGAQVAAQSPVPTVPSQRAPPVEPSGRKKGADRGGAGFLMGAPPVLKYGAGVGVLAVTVVLFLGLGGVDAIRSLVGKDDSASAGLTDPSGGVRPGTPIGPGRDSLGEGGGGMESPPAEIRLNTADVLLSLGEQHRLVAEVLDASGRPLPDETIRWSSDRPAVAFVDSAEGLVSGLSPGYATITAEVGSVRQRVDVRVGRADPVSIDSPAVPLPPPEECADPMALVDQILEGLDTVVVAVLQERRQAAVRCWARSADLSNVEKAQLAYAIGEVSYKIEACGPTTILWYDSANHFGASDPARAVVYKAARDRCRGEQR